MSNNKIKSFWKKLRFSYKVTLFNENTLAMVWEFRVSRLTALLAGTFAVIIIGIITIYLITSTPLRRALPGYISADMRSQIIDNALAVDSLAHIVDINSNYLNNISYILSGEIETDSITNKEQPLISYPIDSLLPASSVTNMFTHEYKEDGKYTLDVFKHNINENLILYPPVKGAIVRRFNPQKGIFGIHITPARQSNIASILDGTVIATYYSLEYGYIIEIQHENNYISIYRYNSKLLKNVGEKVAEGENIALSGNRKIGQSNPSVEFQLWHEGTPLNPMDYIRF